MLARVRMNLGAFDMDIESGKFIFRAALKYTKLRVEDVKHFAVRMVSVSQSAYARPRRLADVQCGSILRAGTFAKYLPGVKKVLAGSDPSDAVRQIEGGSSAAAAGGSAEMLNLVRSRNVHVHDEFRVPVAPSSHASSA